VQLQPLAEVLPICRLGDKLRSPSAQQSQGILALGIDVEHFLKIEDAAATLVCPSSDAKEFLHP